MKKSFLLFLLTFVCGFVVYSQSKANLDIVKKAVALNDELEFRELVKLFDTTTASGRRRTIEPFALHSVWASFREQFGEFKQSSFKKSFTKKNIEYIVEELEFDSGYVDLKFGFGDNHKIKSYLITKSISKADKQLEEKYRVPAYVNQKNVVSQQVTFGSAPFIMQAELTLPKGLKTSNKIAAIVLIHGSGPGDKDAKNGPQQPFRDIAYGLSSKGIAVIRYDKRTLTYAEECAEDSFFTVTQETVLDALEAVKFLKTQSNIDGKKIIVLGHSLGGMMLPRIATMDTTIAGAIFMAAPAMSLPDKVIEQMNYLSTIYPDKKKNNDKAVEEFVRLKTKWYDSTTNPRFLPFGARPIYWMDLDNYNQTEKVKEIKAPMLFLQGDKDYQVTEEDFDLWKTSLTGNNNVTFRLFKNLSHNMTTVTGKPSPEDYKVPTNVSQQVIDVIDAWVEGLK